MRTTAEARQIKAMAVALVAMNKALASLDPKYRDSLQGALCSATLAGIPESDLQFLRLMLDTTGPALGVGQS